MRFVKKTDRRHISLSDVDHSMLLHKEKPYIPLCYDSLKEFNYSRLPVTLLWRLSSIPTHFCMDFSFADYVQLHQPPVCGRYSHCNLQDRHILVHKLQLENSKLDKCKYSQHHPHLIQM